MRRRDFLKGMVLAGTAISFGAETQRFKHLFPFLEPPENVVAGMSTWFATSCRECPAGCGLLVRNRDAHAVKVEGNPLHPISAGKTCARGQAFLQGLYDPDRLTRPQERREGKARDSDWNRALQALGQQLAALRGSGRVAVISDLQTGSLEALIRRWLGAFGSDRYLIYEPLNYEPVREANRAVYGRAEIPDYRFDQADLIVSFAADFLETWISPVKFIGRFASGRVPSAAGMSKFVYVGPRLSQTAMSADEYYLVRPGEERDFALAVLTAMGRDVPGFAPEAVGPRIGVAAERLRRLAQQLQRAKNPLVVGGSPHPGNPLALESATAAALLQAAAGGRTVDFGRVHALSTTATHGEIASFVETLGSGQVQALLAIGANPAYSLSPSLRFAEALGHVPTVISITPFADETAELATWVLPASHPLETWGDFEPEMGVRNLMQPVMGLRYDTRSPGEILFQLAEAAGLGTRATFGAGSWLEFVQRRWGQAEPPQEPASPEQSVVPATPWQEAVQRGGRWTESAAVTPTASGTPPTFSAPSPRGEYCLWVYPSPLLYDGRSANKRWLQEIQDPATHAVWGSWVEMHWKTAARLGARSGQVTEIETATGAAAAPAFFYNGVAPDTLAIPLGQGHTAYGRYAAGRGANAFALLAPGAAPSVRVAVHANVDHVVTTDGTWGQHGRHIIEALSLSELASQRPRPMTWPLPEGYGPDTDLYSGHGHVGHRWAMAVDLARCVGCETCMAACYAENSMGVVGREWMSQGREMYWLRLTRYFDWEARQPALFLPMMCQHCDAGPCEPVCPVFAAAHTEEGLNQQIYNRCIGTRYCSNNCPYKVRRFNWRNYEWPESLTWQLNPEVTVRSRGVMEKCTFCVQRIRAAEYRAKVEGRPVRDGEILPACVQACPAGVYTFGDLLDPASAVSRLVRSNPRRFQVLQDLNTKPAVFYLLKVVNDEERV